MNPANWSFKKIVAAILFGAIIFVFAMFGVNNSQHGGDLGGAAAIVEGTPISIAAFRERLNQLETQYKWMADMGGEEGRKRFNQQIRFEALRSLVEEEVLSQAARKQGVYVSDAELRDQIVRLPFLNENGQFRRDRYDQFLQYRNMRAEDFENEIRKTSVRAKLMGAVQGAFWPTKSEAEQFLKDREYQYKVRVLDASQLSGGEDKVSQAEVNAFLSSPENEKKVEAYYNSHALEFAEPEKVRARHILVKVDDKRSAAEAKKIIEDARKRVAKEDFAKVAMEVSEDPASKVKGGDLDYFTRGTMVEVFDKAAFSQKVGEVSEPIQSEFGYHIIKVEDKKPAKKLDLAEAKPVIARKMLAEKSVEQALSHKNLNVIEQMAKSKGLKWEDVGPFDLAQGVPRLGRAESLMAYLSGNVGTGLVPFVVVDGARRYVVDVRSREKNKNFEKADLNIISQQVAAEKLQSNLSSWLEEQSKNTKIQQNTRLLQ